MPAHLSEEQRETISELRRALMKASGRATTSSRILDALVAHYASPPEPLPGKELGIAAEIPISSVPTAVSKLSEEIGEAVANLDWHVSIAKGYSLSFDRPNRHFYFRRFWQPYL